MAYKALVDESMPGINFLMNSKGKKVYGKWSSVKKVKIKK